MHTTWQIKDSEWIKLAADSAYLIILQIRTNLFKSKSKQIESHISFHHLSGCEFCTSSSLKLYYNSEVILFGEGQHQLQQWIRNANSAFNLLITRLLLTWTYYMMVHDKENEPGQVQAVMVGLLKWQGSWYHLTTLAPLDVSPWAPLTYRNFRDSTTPSYLKRI